MALFTLDRTSDSSRSLQYEQLNGDETHTASSALPTDSASQTSSTESRRTLEGATIQASGITPLKPIFGSTGGTDSSQHTGGNQPLPGNFGLQAATQNIAASPNLATPASSNGADYTNGSSPITGESHAVASSDSSSQNLTQIAGNTIINNPGETPGTPGNPADPGTPTPGGPVIVVDVGGTHDHIPLVQADASIPTDLHGTVIAPVTNLLTTTVTDLASGNPDTVPNLVTNTVSTLDTVVHNLVNPSSLNLTLNNLAQDSGTPPLVHLGVLPGSTDAGASVAEIGLLHNAPSLTDIVHNPASLLNGVLAEISIGGDASPHAEGGLADINLLGNASTVPVVGDLLSHIAGSTPLVDVSLGNNGTPNEASLANVNIGLDNLQGILTGHGSGPLVELNLGHDNTPASEGSLLDLNLANGIPGLDHLPGITDTALLGAPADAVGNIVSTLTDALGNLPSTLAGNPVTGAVTEALASLAGPADNPVVSNVTDTVSHLADTLSHLTNPADNTPLGNLTDALGGLAHIATITPASTDSSGLNLSLGGRDTTSTSVTNVSLLGNLGLTDTLSGQTPLVEITLGNDTSSSNGSLLDLNLLGTPSSDNSILHIPASTDGGTASLIDIGTLSGADLPATNILSQVLNTAATPVADIVSQINDSSHTVTGTTNDLLGNLLGTVNNLTNVVADTAATTIDATSHVASTVAGSVGDVVASTAAALQNPSTSSVADIIASSISAASNTTATATSTANNVIASVVDTTNHAAASTTSTVNNTVSSVVSAITTITTPVVTIPHTLLHGLHF